VPRSSLAAAILVDGQRVVDRVEHINANEGLAIEEWGDMPPRVKPVARWRELSDLANGAGIDTSAFEKFATAEVPPYATEATKKSLAALTPAAFKLRWPRRRSALGHAV
jgi:hypothetical protein